MLQHLNDDSRLDDYKRQEIYYQRALRALRWFSRQPGETDWEAPTEEDHKVGRDMALLHLKVAAQMTQTT